MNENIIVPPPPPLHPLLADRNRGRGRPDSNNRKNSDKGVYCCLFCNYIIFFYGSKGSKHLSGGGGGVQLFIIFFFWGGGGVGGGTNPYFYRNLYNL